MVDFKPIELDNAGNVEPPSEFGDSATGPAFFLGGNAGNGGSSDGDVDSAGERFDDAIHSGRDKRNADGSWRKKRGRKSNSSTNRSGSKASNQANIESLTSILAIVHAGLATATKVPELALELDEAQALANASAEVLIQFDIQPNPKVQAIVGLVMVAGSIYGPRIYMIRERVKEERKDNASRA